MSSEWVDKSSYAFTRSERTDNTRSNRKGYRSASSYSSRDSISEIDDNVEVMHTRNNKRGGGVKDVIMHPPNRTYTRYNQSSSNDGRKNVRGKEVFSTPNASPTNSQMNGKNSGESSWFPMSIPSIGSLISQPSDENPSTQSGSRNLAQDYSKPATRSSPRFGSFPVSYERPMSPTIQSNPSALTNPFSSRSDDDTLSPPRNKNKFNPFGSRSPSTSPNDDMKRYAQSNKKSSPSQKKRGRNPFASISPKSSPTDQINTIPLSKSAEGSRPTGDQTMPLNPFSSRSRSTSRSPTINGNPRSYSRSPSPVYERPSRKITTDQSEFHRILSCAATPEDAQFIEALEILAASKNPRKLAQTKLSDAQDWTALHIASLSNPPLYIIYALLLVYPEAAREVDSDGRLPLHLAAGSDSSVCVVNAITRFNNDAVCAKDSRGFTPLHLALLRDGKEEIKIDALRILLGQSIGRSEAVIDLGGKLRRGVKDGYLRNKEHLNLELNQIQGGLFGVSKNAAALRDRKRREKLANMNKTDQLLSRGFAANISQIDSQDDNPFHHDHLSSLWENDEQYDHDPFGDLELIESNKFTADVQRYLKQLAQWKKKYDKDHPKPDEDDSKQHSNFVNPATIPSPTHFRLPLHMAVRRNHNRNSKRENKVTTLSPPPNQNEILRILIHAYPPALTIKDTQDKTPLMTCLALIHHPAMHPVDLDTIELLLGTRTIGYRPAPKWLEDMDFSRQHQSSIARQGYKQDLGSLAVNAAMIPCDETYPLHIAAREALSTPIVQAILTSYPGAKYAQDERDCTPLHCILENLTGSSTINLEVVKMLMDEKVLRLRDKSDQSIFDLLVINGRNGKLPTKNVKTEKTTAIFKPVFHQVVVDEVYSNTKRREVDDLLVEIHALPPMMRKQACATEAFQYLLSREISSAGSSMLIFMYGIILLTLAITFTSMVDNFISETPETILSSIGTQKTAVFITNAYLSIHGIIYAILTIRLNISIIEALSNIWTWVSFTALLTSFIVAISIENDVTTLNQSYLISLSTVAVGTLWFALLGYLARWWYGIGLFCASVMKVSSICKTPVGFLFVLANPKSLFPSQIDGQTNIITSSGFITFHSSFHANGLHCSV